jgi:RNA polymerase sigma factor (sigma-70 family)
LEHSDRFLPWLRNIVRHKAIDYLRRSKHHRSEINDPEWERIPDDSAGPENQALHNDWLTSISELTKSLTDRNKSIFEAHFFQQMPPEEIASLYETTVSNVYTILSRSKVKLHEQRFRDHVIRYVQERTALGQPVKQMLRVPNPNSP